MFLIIYIVSNSHKLSSKDLQVTMQVYNNFVCLVTYILKIYKYFVIFSCPPHLIFNWRLKCKFLKFMSISRIS